MYSVEVTLFFVGVSLLNGDLDVADDGVHGGHAGAVEGRGEGTGAVVVGKLLVCYDSLVASVHLEVVVALVKVNAAPARVTAQLQPLLRRFEQPHLRRVLRGVA